METTGKLEHWYRMTETISVHPVSFPPEVLARISPDLTLQRHLSLGIRPSLRKFDEFRDVQINEETLSRYSEQCQFDANDTSNGILGSNVLKSGNTMVITTITGGIIEDAYNNEFGDLDIGEQELLHLEDAPADSLSNYTSIYPVVEVERGRVGACTDEEMTISQKLYQSLLYSRVLPKSSLKVKPGVRSTDENGISTITYPDGNVNDDEMSNVVQIKKKWSYVLYAKITVFGRTGPVFDLCWNSLIYALQSTKLPMTFIDEKATDLRVSIRTKGRSTTVKETYEIFADPKRYSDLVIKKERIAYSTNFGIIELNPEEQILNGEESSENSATPDGTDATDVEMDVVRPEPETVLLADIDTEAEEATINSTVNILTDEQGKMCHFSINGGGAIITPELIRNCLTLANERSSDLSRKCLRN